MNLSFDFLTGCIMVFLFLSMAMAFGGPDPRPSSPGQGHCVRAHIHSDGRNHRIKRHRDKPAGFIKNSHCRCLDYIYWNDCVCLLC